MRRALLPRPQLRAPLAWSVSSCWHVLTSRRHVLTVRHHGWGWGTNGVSGAILAWMEGGGGKLSILGVGRGEWRTLRPTSGVSGPHRLRRTLGQELSNRNSRTGTLEQEPSNRNFPSLSLGTLLVRPFVVRGSAPSLRPVLCSTSLRGVSRKLSKGGVPPP